jgi:dTDP-4-dehydrorhamnose reductase
MDALARRGVESRAWIRPDYDLDEPAAAARMVVRDAPGLVIHAAAWTDVDGCARDPALAERRNGEAVGDLAEACAAAGCDMVYVSTNEVFDGTRTDGQGYRETDPTDPPNPYGASKLLGERLARDAHGIAGDHGPRLWIVRTSWLFGPRGADFPRKILAARERLPPHEPLRVVTDEVARPTYAPDLAGGILRIVSASQGGTYHLVNEGAASRFEWAREVLEACGRPTELLPVTSAEFIRASRPPAWGVLDSSAAASMGVRLPPWRSAFRAYVPTLCGG